MIAVQTSVPQERAANERFTLAYRRIIRTGIITSGLLLTAGAVAPAVAQTSVDQGTPTHREDRGFDQWGLLGLIGLAGLAGRKRERNERTERNVPHTARI
jgi:hypothetical protein